MGAQPQATITHEVILDGNRLFPNTKPVAVSSEQLARLIAAGCGVEHDAEKENHKQPKKDQPQKNHPPGSGAKAGGKADTKPAGKPTAGSKPASKPTTKRAGNKTTGKKAPAKKA